MHEIMMLDDTLRVFENGFYVKDGEKRYLKLSDSERREARVFLPEQVHSIRLVDKPSQKCRYTCENADSFAAARRMYAELSPSERGNKEILVLNFANPVNPGGGVRDGALAQEEDLCRKSSLLLSLESKAAEAYYGYNRSLHSYMSSDAAIITPKAEIIKDENGDYLEETEIVSVITCAAPIVCRGLGGMREDQYLSIFEKRILGILKCAAYCGYENLVLGAFGCGAFGNDARVVSDLFYKVLAEFERYGAFRNIDFAVLSNSASQYNLREFMRNFGGN